MKLAKLLPRSFVLSQLRRKAKLHQTPIDTYQVRIARTVEEYEDAFSLLHIAYAYIGIEGIRGKTMRITSQHTLPESTVIVAYEGQSIVGTITVTIDSPAGLPLEKDYPEEVRALRRGGAVLGEIGSLAVVKRCWHTGVTTLLSVAALAWLRQMGVTDTVIGIHPKAVPWYQAVYNFRPMGQPHHHADLNAPVQGLVADLQAQLLYVDQHFRQKLSNDIPYNQAFRHLDMPCFALPRVVERGHLTRWKMSRQVFQELFIKKSDRLDSLEPEVRSYLEEWRTPATLMSAVENAA